MGQGQGVSGSGIFDYFGSSNFKNLGAGLEGISSVFNIGTGIYGLWQTNKALNLQKDALNEAKKQNSIENDRFNKRETERIEANKIIADSSKNWDENPFLRN